ncbi:SDR family oxidoreductase [Kribbella sp. NPDC004536]|uniref:SDR family oxidoreductase n=1 Tax=Kribbella sp. NPDC004536 TaxID=3364106 RepID=UPI0036770DAD
MAAAKVLVTGATGFLAGHCIKDLLEHGYAVRGTVRSTGRTDLSYLERIAKESGGELELVPADLTADGGWDAAMSGCDYVMHVASPLPAKVPKDENDVIRPAVDGTRRVVRAAVRSGSVRRAILTSSTAAITQGHGPADRVYTEADWSIADTLSPYPKSKLFAEKAAWELATEAGLELVSINPDLVVGPLLHAEGRTSIELIRRLMSGRLPAVPPIGFAVVDVRDVAAAHRLALETPKAANNRFIVASPPALWLGEIATILREEFGPRGYKIPSRRLPYWLMWLMARFDPAIRLALTYYDLPIRIDARKAQDQLGWTPRSAAQAICAAAESLIDHGLVQQPSRRR